MTEQISVRIESEMIQLVTVAKERGEQLSDFVRSIRLELVNLGYLGENERKSLGVGYLA
ncbi:MAG: hypothetical protein ACREA7_06380 [Nitrosotalea sp.]